MKYLRVKNWDKFQHDSTKPLPWIKFFTALLAPTKEPWYSELPDAQKALLHHVWLMARVFNGKIPETWLTKEKLNLQSKVKLDKLIESGSVWFEDENGQILSPSRTRVARSVISESSSLGSSEGESEGERFDVAAVFAEFWTELLTAKVPTPAHKATALKAFKKTVTSPAVYGRLRTALVGYRSAPRVQRGFVQDASTWLNDWEQWEALAAPAKVETDDERAVRLADEESLQALRIHNAVKAVGYVIRDGEPSDPDHIFNSPNPWPEIDELVCKEPGESRWQRWVNFCEKRGMSPVRKTA